MTNLILAAGLAATSVGALVLFASHRAVHRTATQITAGYPRVLLELRLARHDAHLGLAILVCGGILQLLAAFGYAAPMSAWRYPTFAAMAAFLPYIAWRVLALHWTPRRPARPAGPRDLGPRVYETRRSFRLRQAALAEAPALQARENARAPKPGPVVCLAHELDRRWWSEKLGVSADTLKAAVRQVGPMAADVERYLSSTRLALAA